VVGGFHLEGFPYSAALFSAPQNFDGIFGKGTLRGQDGHVFDDGLCN
jgi:hypothetical protein